MGIGTMKRLGLLMSGLSVVTGVLILVLYVAVEFEQIQQWEIWNPFRRGPDADVRVLIARLRNDPAGGHTEDVVEAVKKTAMVHYRLPREWPDSKDTEDAKQRREVLFSETDALVLIEGYVGGAVVSLRVWPEGREQPTEYSFERSAKPESTLAGC